MENEIYTFKTEISNLIDKNQMKVWLAKKHGKRVEHVFKIGTEQFIPPQTIVENADYVLLGQNIADVKEQLLDLFEQYIEV
ncbi:hypothetical protein [Halanaerobaculum tunisiense]